jgi:hypothetical protein
VTGGAEGWKGRASLCPVSSGGNAGGGTQNLACARKCSATKLQGSPRKSPVCSRGLGFELRVSSLQSRCSTTRGLSPAWNSLLSHANCQKFHTKWSEHRPQGAAGTCPSPGKPLKPETCLLKALRGCHTCLSPQSSGER